MFVELPATKMSFLKRKLVYGVGINDADYIVYSPKARGKKMCPYYKVWAHMLERCYGERCQAKYPTYLGCTVSTKWHIFSTFKKWMKTQDWPGNDLDKDILVPGNKHYSPEYCVFVPHETNKILTYGQSTNSGLPIGVNHHGRGYRAKCKRNGRTVSLGTYRTRAQAGEAYNEYKADCILEAANEQSDPKIIAGLLAHRDIVLAL